MRTLDRKLWRELQETKMQVAAITLVIASGVAVFVMSLSTLGFLTETRDAYYDRYRFADLFAGVQRAPQPLEDRIAAIPGIAVTQTRVVSQVTLDVPGLLEPAVGQLVSLPDDGVPKLNAVYLRRGRMPEPERAGEVLVSDSFFEANQLQLGDSIDAVLNGRLQALTIVGVALSPEYVLQVRSGELLPDNRRFGIFWMPRLQMESVFDMDGAFNDVSVRLLRGANEKQVIDQLDALLKPYGGVGAVGRDQQISARFLDDEITQLRATGLIAPTIFMGVAAFLLNIVLSRRIAMQRVVIAGLKAFGYTNLEIGWHYLKTSLLIAVLGTVLGAAGGSWMGSGLARMYSQFYRFPTFVYQADYRTILLALGISLLAAVVGSLRAVSSAVRLPPAEAMRPAAPAIYRRSILESLGLEPWIPLPLRMILRSLQRRPVAAGLSSLGIAFSVSVMVMSGFTNDALDYLVEFEFETAQRQDIQVSLYEVTSPAARHDLRHLPGVQAVEVFRAVPVNLRFQHREYRTSILGLPPRRDLYRLLNADGQPIRLPPTGMVLNDKLAEILHVQAGQTVTVEVLEGEEPVRHVQVTGLAAQFSGANAYMERQQLNQLMRESDVFNGAYLAVDSDALPPLYQELKRTPQIASVTIKDATIRAFRETIATNQTTMLSFTIFFAGVIAIGVVYNTARLSLDERSRELATLRVIGFTRREVSTILLGELAVLTIVAVPLGWLIGYGFCAAMTMGFETEMFRIPLVIQSATYARAGIVVAIAAAISGLIVRRRLDHLDLVEVLKSNE
ncbi:ABC transporter permease [Roseimaritima ulvae]|uniref:FtsX-like permease family protein n=1 Tax=Roseimaritima ulvae TaxID=980254 RepID=A0A5B9QTA9_9BACT|nr:ABC transporter permease [Roseimaritima ulvae]QEG41179.1 FtsX-like permease family protein [Roseimaritima ulvae]